MMIKSVLSSLMLLFSFGAITGQTTGYQTLKDLNDSPAGKQIVAFIEAINTKENFATEDVRAHFSEALIAKHGSEMLLGFFKDIKENDGQLELYDAFKENAFKYMLKCKGTKHQEWLDVGIRMDEESPNKIIGLEGIAITPEGPQGEKPMISVY